MSNTILSIFTLYNWDETIFDTMVMPIELDRTILVDNLILDLAEFEILYSNPDFLKLAIARWSSKELSVWEKEYATTMYEYNAIENYNRTEESLDTQTRNLTGSDNETRNLTGSDNETRDLANTGTNSNVVDGEINRSGEDTNTKSVSAYNETVSLTDSEKDILTQGTKEETDSTITDTGSGTDTGTVNKATTDAGTVNKATTDTGTVVDGRTSNMKGNIGVTTTQQMIDQERKSVEFNVYNYIINSFKLRFCITVY